MPLLFILLYAFYLLPNAAAASSLYEDELAGKAAELRLSDERYWEVLLHYKKGLFGTKSLIDDPKFFLAEEGKKDPEAELEATIRSFFRENADEGKHPRCKFPARYKWLKEILGIDETRLPQAKCARLEDTFFKVNPKSATLVFPDAFMNSPASMFGHTLLRIDSTHESSLLSYAVNYAASTDETSGLTFAIKGMFGFYKGYFSILPYYKKVKEYNNMRDRDMWEYTLTLSEEEVERMFLHLWELEEIYSDYYFFDENCSYNLLFLIEAARPSLRLTDDFSYWVIPVDTIKVVSGEGIIGKKEFRPSISTRIRHMISRMDEGPQEIGLRRADNEMSPGDILSLDLKKKDKVMAFDLATEIIQYRYANGEITKDEYNVKFIENLKARSGLGKGPDDFYNVTPPTGPEHGHNSGRISIGSGVRENTNFGEIRFRPAYHTLADPDEGYLSGSQIVFGDFVARYYEERGLKLERVDVIDILSISPRDKFFKPLSWKVITGVKNKIFPNEEHHHVYYVNPGFGLAYKNDLMGLYYAMVESDAEVSSELDKEYAVSLGISAGMTKKIGDSWKVNLLAKRVWYELGDEHHAYRITLNQNFKMGLNAVFSVDYSRERAFQITEDEISLNWNYYF